jgi:hypothetical protein
MRQQLNGLAPEVARQQGWSNRAPRVQRPHPASIIFPVDSKAPRRGLRDESMLPLGDARLDEATRGRQAEYAGSRIVKLTVRRATA